MANKTRGERKALAKKFERDPKSGRFKKKPPKPLPDAVVKQLGALIVPIREPANCLEALMPRLTFEV